MALGVAAAELNSGLKFSRQAVCGSFMALPVTTCNALFGLVAPLDLGWS